MPIVIAAVSGVYLCAVNVYAFLLVRSLCFSTRSRALSEGAANKKLFIAALLGGAVCAYIAMLVYRCKTNELLPMILIFLVLFLVACLPRRTSPLRRSPCAGRFCCSYRTARKPPFI